MQHFPYPKQIRWHEMFTDLHNLQESRKEWLEKKKEQEQLQKEKEKEEQEKKAEEEMERKQKAQEAYAKWKMESKKKPVPVPNGYAYSQGMLKGEEAFTVIHAGKVTLQCRPKWRVDFTKLVPILHSYAHIQGMLPKWGDIHSGWV